MARSVTTRGLIEAVRSLIDEANEAEIDDVNLVYKDNDIDIDPDKSTIDIIFTDPTSGEDKTVNTSIKNVSPMV